MTDRYHSRWRAALKAPFSRRAWLAVTHVLVGLLLWMVPAYLAFGVAGAATQVSRALDGGQKLLDLTAGLVVFAAALVGLVALTPRFTAWQRARFRAVLGVDLAPYPSPPTGFVPLVADRATWRQVRYHALAGALTTVLALLMIASAGAGLTFVALSLFAHRPALAPVFVALGLLLMPAAPAIAIGATSIDLSLGRSLLQPSGTVALAEQVRSLSASRAGVVDAADAERRRIERDLHDGTQQRLVSLAMKLGMSRAATRDMPAEVRDTVAEAHEEAKAALAELRHFIRGLHPAVLDELGLDAALSGIAARSPVPVHLEIDLPARPPAAIETVAYFVVSETLANVARHAGATRVDVTVRRDPAGLLLRVTDDGTGGADPHRGTGLLGLRQRVEAVDGTLRLDSPPGGPTTVAVRLPCAS